MSTKLKTRFRVTTALAIVLFIPALMGAWRLADVDGIGGWIGIVLAAVYGGVAGHISARVAIRLAGWMIRD